MQEKIKIITAFCERFRLSLAPSDDGYFIENYELKFTGYDWAVFRLITIPGKMYMPNGDPGYPDEQDYQEVGIYPDLLDALEMIGFLIVTDHINEEKMVQELSVGDEL